MSTNETRDRTHPWEVLAVEQLPGDEGSIPLSEVVLRGTRSGEGPMPLLKLRGRSFSDGPMPLLTLEGEVTGGEGPQPLLSLNVSSLAGSDGPQPLSTLNAVFGCSDGPVPLLTLNAEVGRDRPQPLVVGVRLEKGKNPQITLGAGGRGVRTVEYWLSSFYNETSDDVYLTLYGTASNLVTHFAKPGGLLIPLGGQQYVEGGDYLYALRSATDRLIGWGKITISNGNPFRFLDGQDQFWNNPHAPGQPQEPPGEGLDATIRDDMQRLAAELARRGQPVRPGRGVTTDFEFDASGTFQVGEQVTLSGAGNITVDAGEPAGLYLFFIYVMIYDGHGQSVHRELHKYSVLSNGDTPSGQGAIVLAKVGCLPAGGYKAVCVVTVLRPGATAEEELRRQSSTFQVV